MQSLPDVSWPRIAAFVRRHGHDLCNELNGLDLQATLAAEFATDPEVRDGLKRMRVSIRQIAADLRALSDKVAEPLAAPSRVEARILVALWQEEEVAHAGAPLAIEWQNALGGEAVKVDVNGIAWAFREMLANAAAFPAAGRLIAAARVEEASVIFELREPKSAPIDTARWGLAPFESLRHGHYGLGLCTLARTIAASGGSVAWHCTAEPCELVTTIRFPVVG